MGPSERVLSSESLSRISGHHPVSFFFCRMGDPVSQNVRKTGLKANATLDKSISSIVSETSKEENLTGKPFQEICSRSISFL